ncbi:MAG: hypothetical protein M3P29_06040, partial [Acidobacteriota bacterium]|nr:hypothetical protein [Acidobacteriota bacterium]
VCTMNDENDQAPTVPEPWATYAGGRAAQHLPDGRTVSFIMRNLLAAVAFTLVAISATAQPARDLVDANAAARQHARDIEPALALMRNEADALSKISEIQSALSGMPLSSIDRALHLIDDFSESVVKRGLALPHDQQKIIMIAQSMLEDAHRVTPADYPKFRDDFHHLVVHPLQVLVSRDMQHLMSLTNQYERIVGSVRNLETHTINAIYGAASDPTRQ